MFINGRACVGASTAALNFTAIPYLYQALVSPPISECVQTAALGPTLALLGTPNASLVPALDSYGKAVCPAPVCSTQAIGDLLATFETAFGDVYEQYGITDEQVAAFLPFLPDVKQIACLEDASTASGNALGSKNCLIQTLSAVEKAIATPISFGLITSLLTGEFALSSIPLQLIAPAICTDCTKSIYDYLIDLDYNTHVLSNNGLLEKFTGFFGGVCGATFIDCAKPEAVVQTANVSVLPDASA